MRQLVPMKDLILFCLFVPILIQAQLPSGEMDDDEMCFPFRRSSSMRPPSDRQGRPGKQGAAGPPGPKGDQGVAGECGCDPNEVAQLNRTIQEQQSWFLFFGV